jgi:carbon monoxide dehydrogenase subunit G
MSELSLTFLVATSPAQVFSYLSDMQRFVAIHPVISRAEAIGRGYLLHETLSFLGIPVSFSYPAAVVSDAKQNRVLMNATVFGLVHVEICFDVLAENGCTRVNEAVTFRSWLPVHYFMKRTFSQQHALLFENLKAVSEAAAA